VKISVSLVYFYIRNEWKNRKNAYLMHRFRQFSLSSVYWWRRTRRNILSHTFFSKRGRHIKISVGYIKICVSDDWLFYRWTFSNRSVWEVTDLHTNCYVGYNSAQEWYFRLPDDTGNSVSNNLVWNLNLLTSQDTFSAFSTLVLNFSFVLYLRKDS
jgi:hypothetical protein